MEDKQFGESGNKIVIEEFLTGPEVSVLAFTDGHCVKPMVSSKDHKRAYDNDKGLNTGGMGTVSPNPYYTDALADEFGVTIHIVTGSFREMLPNGSVQTVTPWEATAVIGTTTDVVGRLVYGTLAEETNPVNDVDYQKIGSHTLISKFSKTDPLVEFTAGQALCIPVIDNVNSIYKLSTTAAETPSGGN
jgi:hypothetical protein